MAKQQNLWTDSELHAAVDLYFHMLNMQCKGQSYNKRETIERALVGDLSARSRKSVEFRLMNISSVLDDLGLETLHGYVGLENVGTRNRGILLAYMHQQSYLDDLGVGEASDDLAVYEARTLYLLENDDDRRPEGCKEPTASEGVVKRYRRCPKVKAYVLKRAEGNCELCGKAGPFEIKKGIRYLEVHHIVPMSEGGADVVENVAGLCPNCHRACHYATNQDELALRLGEIVKAKEQIFVE